MGIVTVPIQLETNEYQQLTQLMKEFNYFFNDNLDLKQYCEHIIKTEIAIRAKQKIKVENDVQKARKSSLT